MAKFDFVADYEDLYKGYEPLPAGEYKVQITDSDIQTPSKDEHGEMLVLEYEVVADPQFEGRKIKEWLKFKGSGDLKSAIQKINTIFFLTKTKATKDTAQLLGKTLSVLVGVKEDETYGKTNFIKKHLPFNGRDDEDQDQEQPKTSAKKHSFVKKQRAVKLPPGSWPGFAKKKTVQLYFRES